MASFTSTTNNTFTQSFNNYATEIRQLCTQASKLPTATFVSQTQELLSILKIEARGCDDRKAAMAEYNAIKLEVDRSALLGSGSAPSNSNTGPTSEVKKRFMATNEKIDNQNKTLERIQQNVAEIEDVGGEITTQLHSNREQIQKQQDRVKEGE